LKLFYSPASEYVRKVMATAIECGLTDRIELINGRDDLPKHNPLRKIPTLITDEGRVIVDSPVICEYLDRLAGGRLIPADGEARWTALTREAIADGVMESATMLRHDKRFHAGHESAELGERYRVKIEAGLDRFEDEAGDGKLDPPVTIGHLTIAICCGYLDFRKIIDWRKDRPALADWYEEFSKRPSLAKTEPREYR
jgi:glutathione S-transferase